MKVSELEGRALDYWCARALVGDDGEISFVEVEPTVVVTVAGIGEARGFPKLDERFTPTDDWRDAGSLIELASDVRLTVGEDGSAHCRATFEGATLEGRPAIEAGGPGARIALARAFVVARFGETVDDDYPKSPHAVRRGVVVPADAGGVVPTFEDDRERSTGETGDIRSVPRL
jgi:Protein of unknown function (DUF2591)